MKKLYNLPFSINEPSKHWKEIVNLSKSDKSRKGAIIRKFLDLVEEDFRHKEGKTLQKDFARKLNTSASNLGKNCLDVVRVSPSDCIQARLIAEACKLLVDETELTIGSVADRLGYGKHPNYFFRLFKKYTGYTPTAFRKEVSKTI